MSIRDRSHARQSCDDYLSQVSQADATVPAETFNNTVGLLFELIKLLEDADVGDGLSQESLASLRRLGGSNYLSLREHT